MSETNRIRQIALDPNGDDLRNVNHEDLTTFVALKAYVPSRSSVITSVNSDKTTEAKYTSVGGKVVNFMPFTTALDKDGNVIANKLTTAWSRASGRTGTENEELETLGITSVQMDFNESYVPKVVIDFVDLRGSSIFEKGNESKYASFFNLPYPLFELTVKGYYGKAVTYDLHLLKFNARFNPANGNFEIKCEFIGYTYAMLADILVGYLLAAPYMKTNAGGLTTVDLIARLKKFNKDLEHLKDNPAYKQVMFFGQLKEIYADLQTSFSSLKEKLDIDNSRSADISFVNNVYKIKQGTVEDSELNGIEENTQFHIFRRELISKAEEALTVMESNNDKTLKGRTEDLIGLIKSLEVKNLTSGYEIDLTGISSLGKGLESRANDKRKSILSSLADKVSSDIKTTLDGNEPTISNIFKIILGDAQTFLDLLKSYSIEAEQYHSQNQNLTALNAFENGKIYPWALYYDKTTSKMIYPTDRSMPEVQFVEKFINALGKGIFQLKEAEGEDEGYGFFPLSILEAKFNGGNVPYVGSENGENGAIQKIIERFFAIMSYSYYYDYTDGDTNTDQYAKIAAILGKLEAKNFIYGVAKTDITGDKIARAISSRLKDVESFTSSIKEIALNGSNKQISSSLEGPTLIYESFPVNTGDVTVKLNDTYNQLPVPTKKNIRKIPDKNLVQLLDPVEMSSTPSDNLNEEQVKLQVELLSFYKDNLVRRVTDVFKGRSVDSVVNNLKYDENNRIFILDRKFFEQANVSSTWDYYIKVILKGNNNAYGNAYLFLLYVYTTRLTDSELVEGVFKLPNLVYDIPYVYILCLGAFFWRRRSNTGQSASDPVNFILPDGETVNSAVFGSDVVPRGVNETVSLFFCDDKIEDVFIILFINWATSNFTSSFVLDIKGLDDKLLLVDNNTDRPKFIDEFLKAHNLDGEKYVTFATPKFFYKAFDADETTFSVRYSVYKAYMEAFASELKTGIEKADTNGLAETAYGGKTLDDVRLECYLSFKNIYDKWIASDYLYRINSNSSHTDLFSHFVFVDRAMNDIGKEVVISPNKLFETDYDNNISLYSLISQILVDNHFMFFPMPNYININDETEFSNCFKPFPYVDGNVLQTPSFICMYFGKSSTTLDMPLSYEYRNSGFMIDENINPLPADYTTDASTPAAHNYINAFDVRFGDDNQHLFMGLEMDQQEFKETNESLYVLDRVARNEGQTYDYKDQSLFNIYSLRSYTVGVEMMGCMMIQPLMYFNLRNVPMWRGGYLILSTSHTISPPNKVMTKFKGVRVPYLATPIVKDFAARILPEIFDSEDITSRLLADDGSTDGTEDTDLGKNKIAITSANRNNKLLASNF